MSELRRLKSALHRDRGTLTLADATRPLFLTAWATLGAGRVLEMDHGTCEEAEGFFFSPRNFNGSSDYEENQIKQRKLY